MHADEPNPSDGLASSQRARGRLITRRRLVIAVCLMLIASVGAWWFWPPTLTAEEQALVGKWTLPMGPNPPSNAVQQVFWLKPDRKLLMGSRRVGTTATTYSMAGTWRLETEHLVLNAKLLDPPGTSLARIVGLEPPRAQPKDDRIRILGWEGEVLLIEGADGSVCTYLPFRE